MTSAQVEWIQGNTHIGTILIESYFLQILNFLNSTLNDISALRQSHGSLEAQAISMQHNTYKPNEDLGEPSFVVKPFTGENKEERTKESIYTWLGRWESHFKLYPTRDSTKIVYVG